MVLSTFLFRKAALFKRAARVRGRAPMFHILLHLLLEVFPIF
jgi:hypothetical protein